MQRDPSLIAITNTPGGVPPRPPAEVPSDELWRDAILAARQAASAAAELRAALEASRGVGLRPGT